MPIPHETPPRRQRTFELRDEGWIEGVPVPRRPPLWLLVPAAIVGASTLVLLVFGAVAALATGAILAARAAIHRSLVRLFGR